MHYSTGLSIPSSFVQNEPLHEPLPNRSKSAVGQAPPVFIYQNLKQEPVLVPTLTRARFYWNREKFDVEPKRVIFQGRILNKDEQTLAESKLKDGLTVVVQAAPTTPAPAASPAASATPTPMPTPATAAGTTAGSGAAASQAALAQALAGTIGGLGAGAAGVGPVGQAVATIRGQEAGVARECLTTLTKVVDNIVAHPLEEKYRKIKRTNAGFRRKVRPSVFCSAACSSGFGDGRWEWRLNQRLTSGCAWKLLGVTGGRRICSLGFLDRAPCGNQLYVLRAVCDVEQVVVPFMSCVWRCQIRSGHDTVLTHSDTCWPTHRVHFREHTIYEHRSRVPPFVQPPWRHIARSPFFA